MFTARYYMYHTLKGNKWFSFIITTRYTMCLMQLQPLLMARQDISKCTRLSFFHRAAWTLESSQYLFVHFSVLCSFMETNIVSTFQFTFHSFILSPHLTFTSVTFLPHSYYLKRTSYLFFNSPNSWVIFLHQVTSMGRELFFLTSCFLSTHTWMLALSLLFASTSKPSPLWTDTTQSSYYSKSLKAEKGRSTISSCNSHTLIRI